MTKERLQHLETWPLTKGMRAVTREMAEEIRRLRDALQGVRDLCAEYSPPENAYQAYIEAAAALEYEDAPDSGVPTSK